MEGPLNQTKGIFPLDTEKLNHGITTSIANSEESPVGDQATPFVENAAMERTLTLKCDLRLLPPLMILFMITFIDRINIGNAKIEGMTTELKMKNTDYNKALWILNIPYTILPLPSNMLMKKGFVKPGVLVCRFLMGCFEAGFVPGCAYLIGRYYKRRDFSIRYAMFFGAAVLAGAFGGLLAFGIRNMDGVGGYRGWRWIFIIEGLLTVLTTGIGLLFIPDYPENSKFLKPEEKEYMLEMLKIDAGPSQPNHYNYFVMKECLLDPKIWLATFAYFGADTAASSIVAFQPTILTALGYSKAQAQVHTIPVFIVALVCSLTTSYFSGYLRHRYGFILLGGLIGVVGWSIELTAPISAIRARYFGLFAITTSAYIQMPLLVVWISNNMGGNAKSAFGTGFMIGLGNCGNFVSSNVFITTETPRYRTGFSTGLALCIVSIVVATAIELMLWVSNKRRDAGKENAKFDHEEILEQLGDEHPDFRYIL
ncbi:hypothetical protein CJF30_00010789 [Rutstroemia sp. NJR-2017a BBW]|nr:hypothetical protein CJF30_00010789 [Rutstroemia sp. NJR-2017a BBW]